MALFALANSKGNPSSRVNHPKIGQTLFTACKPSPPFLLQSSGYRPSTIHAETALSVSVSFVSLLLPLHATSLFNRDTLRSSSDPSSYKLSS